MFGIRLLLIHNPVSAHPITWLGGLIQKVTKGRYHHGAVEFEWLKKKWVIESVFPRPKLRTFQEWFDAADREVAAMRAPNIDFATLMKLLSLLNLWYAVGDLWRSGWHYFVTERLDIDRNKEPHNSKNPICIELFCIVLKDTKWFTIPNDYLYHPELVLEEVFYTYKK